MFSTMIAYSVLMTNLSKDCCSKNTCGSLIYYDASKLHMFHILNISRGDCLENAVCMTISKEIYSFSPLSSLKKRMKLSDQS